MTEAESKLWYLFLKKLPGFASEGDWFVYCGFLLQKCGVGD